MQVNFPRLPRSLPRTLLFLPVIGPLELGPYDEAFRYRQLLPRGGFFAMRAALPWDNLLTTGRNALTTPIRDPSMWFPDRALRRQAAEGDARSPLWDRAAGVFGRDIRRAPLPVALRSAANALPLALAVAGKAAGAGRRQSPAPLAPAIATTALIRPPGIGSRTCGPDNYRDGHAGQPPRRLPERKNAQERAWRKWWGAV